MRTARLSTEEICMPLKSTYQTIGVVCAAAVLVLAGCGSDHKADSGAPLDRPAKGELSAAGGAARLGGDQTDAIRQAINGAGARNIILLIGDGMGDSEITIARNYAVGAAGRLTMDRLP
jgi:alkaline phosphatase